MIARIWRGWAPLATADDYQRHDSTDIRTSGGVWHGQAFPVAIRFSASWRVAYWRRSWRA